MGSRYPFHLRRRTVVRGLLSAGAFGLTSQFWTACSSSRPESASSSGVTESGEEPITVGFIYVGPKDDFGYNQSHAAAAATMAASFPSINIVEEASIPETTAVQETMRNMIEQDGAQIIFPTSWGYFDPHSLQLAAEFPDVQFFHPNHPLDPEHPANVGSYFSSLVEPAYLAGVVAGQTTASGTLGLVVPKPIPVVLQEMNAFVLGARSVNPEITARAVITGDWALPVKEAEATNSLIDQGADVLITRVDSPKVVLTTAQERGVYCCGYHVDQGEIAPDTYLTGVEWNWLKAYTTYAEMTKAGKTLMNGGIPKALAGGLKEEFSKISPYGSAASAEAQKAADGITSQLANGEIVIFPGGLKDSQGNIVVPEGDAFKLGDPRLNTIDWFVEGIQAEL
ncbi:BMP family ABC transporter substrate-binding protein [filamentous cyanobacterium CCP5]|nr:BMP family ABC transporter substrate-binding protein [filamentous cyanobacterium CCP5]